MQRMPRGESPGRWQYANGFGRGRPHAAGRPANGRRGGAARPTNGAQRTDIRAESKGYCSSTPGWHRPRRGSVAGAPEARAHSAIFPGAMTECPVGGGCCRTASYTVLGRQKLHAGRVRDHSVGTCQGRLTVWRGRAAHPVPGVPQASHVQNVRRGPCRGNEAWGRRPVRGKLRLLYPTR